MTETATASTEWDGLKPQNVVQAAREDLKRRKRNEIRAGDDMSAAHKVMQEHGYEMERYALMRDHVRQADGAFGLIEISLKAIREDLPSGSLKLTLSERLRRSTKRHMKHLYDRKLLTAALEMER